MQASLDRHDTDKKPSSAAREYLSKGKKLAGILARKSVPLGIKIMTSGALDLEGIKDAGIADLAESLAREKIERYEADKNTIAGFKAHLREFVVHLGNQEKTQSKPLIFFVDELDRCRPTYAIDLLEKIKHLFSVEGLIFVLAIDKMQIGHSIRSIYGAGMDMDGYLRRFIDLEYRLPDPPRPNFCESLQARFNFQEVSEAQGAQVGTAIDFVRSFSELSEIFQLSLRTIEQCFSQFNVVSRTLATPVNSFPSLIAFLLALRAANFRLYTSFTQGTSGIAEIQAYIIGLAKGQEYWNSYYGMELEALYALSQDPYRSSRKVADSHGSILEKLDKDTPQGKRAEQILELMDRLSYARAETSLRSAIRRIELTDPFTTI